MRASTNVHNGPATTYTLELAGYTAKRERLTFSGTSAPVAQGDTLTIKPDWAALKGGLLSVRTAGGSATNRPLT